MLIIALFTSACAQRPPKQDSLTNNATNLVSGTASVDLAKLVAGCTLSDQCELEIYKELAKINHPSHGEGEMRLAVQQLFNEAKHRLWKDAAELTSETDEAGNLLLRLPATGLQAGQNTAPFALQSHMDMVLAVRGTDPGTDLHPFFRNGVTLQEENGWLHSKDYQTTIGADDAIGMAISLRYLLDPLRPHPPLELVFTTAEESGMTGARNLNLHLQATKLINLDSPDPGPGLVTVGSMGGARVEQIAELETELLPAKARLYEVKLSDLKGGHSGLDIHYARLNAIRALAFILKDFLRQNHHAWLLSTTVGPGALNQIPNQFRMTIAVDAGQIEAHFQAKADVNDRAAASDDFDKSISRQFAAIAEKVVRKFPDEDLNGYKLSTQRMRDNAASITRRGLPPKKIQQLCNAFIEMPNGVVRKGIKFPDGIQSSSNLAVLEIKLEVTEAAPLIVNLKSFTRSFDANDLSKIPNKLKSLFVAALAGGDKSKVAIKEGSYPPWMAPASSPLLKLATRPRSFFKKTTMCPCGTEAGFFTQRYAKLDLISVGVNVKEAHTVNEQFEIASSHRLAVALDELLALPELSRP